MRSSKTHFLFFLVLFYCYSMAAQVKLLQFQVIDQSTQQSLPFCYAQVSGSRNTAMADENGFIAIRVTSHDTLILQQLAYYPVRIAVADITEKISMKPKNINLDAVTVTAKKLQVFEENNNLVFIDFEFYYDNILCLVNKGGKYNVLQIRDLAGNTRLEKKLNIKTESIFKDCYGNLHLLSADSIYQVFYNYRTLSILPPYPIADYRHLMKPCVCAINDKAIFKIKEYQSLKNAYIYYDALNNLKKTMACVADSEAITGFKMDYDIRYFLSMRRQGFGYAYSVTDLYKYMDKLRAELELPFEYKNLLRPVESQLINVDTTFVLFDFTNKLVYRFSFSGNFIEKRAFGNFPILQPNVQHDKDAGMIVLSELNNRTGILTLYRYDTKLNKLSHKCSIENMHYIKTYRIKENYLYHINREKIETGYNNKLLKLQLQWQVL